MKGSFSATSLWAWLCILPHLDVSGPWGSPVSFYLGWPNGVPDRRAKRPPRCGQVSGQEGRQQEGQGRRRHWKHPLVLDGATFM